MKKTILFVLIILLIAGGAWYLTSIDSKDTTSYYDPESEKFGLLYSLLTKDEKDCLDTKLGGVRVTELVSLNLELNEAEEKAIQDCTY